MGGGGGGQDGSLDPPAGVAHARWLIALVASWVLVVACDVEVSLGAHDGGNDAVVPECDVRSDAGACLECAAMMCCDAFRPCSAATTCPCITECVLARTPVDDCVTHCGGADHGEHVALVECAAASCGSLCP